MRDSAVDQSAIFWIIYVMRHWKRIFFWWCMALWVGKVVRPLCGRCGGLSFFDGTIVGLRLFCLQRLELHVMWLLLPWRWDIVLPLRWGVVLPWRWDIELPLSVFVSLFSVHHFMMGLQFHMNNQSYLDNREIVWNSACFENGWNLNQLNVDHASVEAV